MYNYLPPCLVTRQPDICSAVLFVLQPAGATHVCTTTCLIHARSSCRYVLVKAVRPDRTQQPQQHESPTQLCNVGMNHQLFSLRFPSSRCLWSSAQDVICHIHLHHQLCTIDPLVHLATLQNGSCPKGDACPLAHGVSQQQYLPCSCANAQLRVPLQQCLAQHQPVICATYLPWLFMPAYVTQWPMHKRAAWLNMCYVCCKQ